MTNGVYSQFGNLLVGKVLSSEQTDRASAKYVGTNNIKAGSFVKIISAQGSQVQTCDVASSTDEEGVWLIEAFSDKREFLPNDQVPLAKPIKSGAFIVVGLTTESVDVNDKLMDDTVTGKLKKWVSGFAVRGVAVESASANSTVKYLAKY